MEEITLAGRKILEHLEKNGYEAYFVGGYVRDYLLHLNPNDIDIATAATPDIVESLFPKTKKDAAKYGAVTVYIDNYAFEVTTFREDISYLNHRHPITKFVSDLNHDLKRRDFTINALAMNLEKKIIDNFQGLTDLKEKLIKAIGDPSLRFEEDALRILRACYFAAKLSFKIEETTALAIKEKASLVSFLSNDRILDEVRKMFNTNNSRLGVKYLMELGIAKHLCSFHDGLNFIYKKELQITSYELFLGVAYYSNKLIFTDYNISQQTKKKIINATNLLKNFNIYDKLSMYEKSLDDLLYANQLAKVLELKYYNNDDIIRLYNELVVKKSSDIAIDVSTLKVLLQKEAGSWIKPLYQELAGLINEGKIKNDKASIEEYLVKEKTNG